MCVFFLLLIGKLENMENYVYSSEASEDSDIYVSIQSDYYKRREISKIIKGDFYNFSYFW